MNGLTHKRSADDDIAAHAYRLFVARGCATGHDLDDWLQAERELRRSRVDTHPEVLDLLDMLRHWQPNILIVGTPGTTADAVVEITARCRRPLTFWSSRSGAPTPDRVSGTVVIDEVDACTPQQQVQLLHWMELVTPRVVATAGTALYPRVEDGRFLPELYYRLNSVLVDLLAHLAQA